MNGTVDAHQHFWELGRFRYDWPTPDLEPIYRDFRPADLKPHLEACGIAGTVVVQAHQSVAEAQWLLELAAKHAWIRGVVGWVDLTAPEVGEVLDRLRADRRFVGVRHLWHNEARADWILQPTVIRGLRELARRGLTFDLLVRPRELAYVPAVARAVPDLRLVVDHIGKPPIGQGVLEPWLERLKAAAAFPQVWCKVSGLVTEADWATWKPSDLRPYVERVVELFGFQRLMFGSDWPVCTLAGRYEDVYAAGLEAAGPMSPSERRRLLGETAAEFYRLPSAG